VVEVNYRGSTGYGRTYRDSLRGRWGVVDVDDCCAVVGYLAERGLADPDRALIRGGSAGGFTALAALAFRDVFRAGSCPSVVRRARVALRMLSCHRQGWRTTPAVQ